MRPAADATNRAEAALPQPANTDGAVGRGLPRHPHDAAGQAPPYELPPSSRRVGQAKRTHHSDGPWELPKGWEWVPIGNLCDLLNGRAFKAQDWGTAGLPIIRIQNLNNHAKPFNYFAGTVEPRHLVKDGDVLISWSGTPGTSFGAFVWNRGPGVLNQHIFRVDFDASRVDASYFAHAVNLRLDELIRRAQGGVGLRHITRGELDAVPLPIPFPRDPSRSLELQRHIVARLEDLLADVREARRLLGEMSSASKALPPSIADDLFNDLAVACAPVVPLGSVLKEKPQYGLSLKASETPLGLPILRMGNIQDGELSFEHLKFLELQEKERGKYLLRDGDILVNRTNSVELVGKCAVFREPRDAVFASYLLRLTARPSKSRPAYLAAYINSTRGRMHIQSKLTRAIGQVNINATNLVEMPVLLPSLARQDEVVGRLEAAGADVGELRQLLTQKFTLLDHLEQSILERAFRGELG
ncbi:MAG: restriction endonuclease subunit S [Deltaproteobacteria bacterium]|nr:restriction endonuclease subunit S [Deltaproteobacteria bacterium]